MASHKYDFARRGNLQIDMREEFQVQDWTCRLAVSRERLQDAIDAVGGDVERVREYLGR